MRNAGTILKDKKGGRPKFYQVIVRELIAPLSSIAWLGYWCAAFTRYPMALHDMISGTRIVYVEKPQHRWVIALRRQSSGNLRKDDKTPGWFGILGLL